METIDFNEVIRDNIEVVGGLIGIFKFHNITGYDVNDLNLENGIYGINKDGNITLNYPKGIEYGTLIHFVGIGISPKLATNNGIQIAISTTKKIAFRLRNYILYCTNSFV